MLTMSAETNITYKKMWEKVQTYENKDLPQSAISNVREIVAQAEKDQNYGQLLTAKVKEMQLAGMISPDSMTAYFKHFCDRRQQVKDDKALCAVYDAVLHHIKRDYFDPSLLDNLLSFTPLTLKDLDEETLTTLSKTKVKHYLPLVVRHDLGKYFNDDMLSVIGYEMDDFETLAEWYSAHGNRQAALLATLQITDNDNKKELARLDSIEAIYSDLDLCGEVVLKKLDFMEENDNASRKEKIDLIHNAMSCWPKYERINALKNVEIILTQPKCDFDYPKSVIPQKPFTIYFNDVRNVKDVELRIGKKKYKKTFSPHEPWEFFKDSLIVEGLPIGTYDIKFFKTLEKISYENKLSIVSTNIQPITEGLPEEKIRVIVVNRDTGRPIPYANIKAESRKSKKMFITDDKGEVIIDGMDEDGHLYSITAYTDIDNNPNTADPNTYYWYGEKKKKEITQIYTDRAIYRPGQTVHATLLTFTTEDDSTQVVSSKMEKVTLRDANYKIIKEQEVKTNAFGKATINFVLPKSSLNGRFTISTNNASQSIRVEEYKRPTFEITFSEVNRQYEEGDTLMLYVQAKSFAGVPVQGAKVKYNVRRKQPIWWWRNNGYDTNLTSDSTTTDTHGGFYVPIKFEMPENADHYAFYNFVADLSVTALNGETHEGSISLPLGRKKMALECYIGDKQVQTSNEPILMLQEEKDSICFRAINAMGNHIDTDVKTTWTEHDGLHTVIAICEDDTLKQDFIFFNKTDTKPCTKTDDWFWTSSDTFTEDGVVVQVGTSNEAYILYSIFSSNKIIKSGHFEANNSLWNRTFKYKEEYGDGIFLHFYWLKDGKSFSHTTEIKKPLPKKDISLKWQTFRDRLTPGLKEEWRLKTNATRQTSLLMTMYDKSLDDICHHSWGINIGITRYLPHSFWKTNQTGTGHIAYWGKIETIEPNKIFSWSHFEESLFPSSQVLYKTVDAVLVGQVRGISSEKSKTIQNAKLKALNEEPIIHYEVASLSAEKEYDASAVVVEKFSETTNEIKGSVRENLNETAFFYPNLLSDENGEFTISFTLPEALTTWHVLGLANTKDMCYGMIEADVVAKKELMLQPNMPRFTRKGDKATISSSIANTSENDLSGIATIEILDIETEKVVLRESQFFSVKQGGTSMVTFNIDTNDKALTSPLYICRVIADAGKFSDGEQHYLPILPSKTAVMNTRTITQTQPGEKNIILSDLIPKGTTDARITIEYTNNPTWIIIQALPIIATPNENDIASNMRAYYSNRLAKQLIEDNPRIQTIIKAWATEEETNKSPLATNQELKTILLNETPWVLDADDETQWRTQMLNYFEKNNIEAGVKTSLDKIKELQLADGSFCWFKGMNGNFHMTLSVAESLARLHNLIGENEGKTILEKAMKWLTKEVHESVKKMKKEKTPYISASMLQYLYTCAIADIELSSQAKADNEYLIAELKKEITTHSIFEKGLTALILNQCGEHSLAKEYLQSLREYSVYKEELGRYYDTPRAGYAWRNYKIPTEVSAIEAISSIDPTDTQTIEEMQHWLLQEKRTQFWDTPMNCMDAIYAFMINNTKALNSQTSTDIAIDGKRIQFNKSTIGLGYVKTTKDYSNQKVVTFNRTSSNIGWGTVYAQFMQDEKDISASQTGISLKRTLSKSTKEIKVGDKIKVTITITADRDYDFIQVNDRRAACMEPARQISGYQSGYYVSPKDCCTNYYFDKLAKGTHKIETEYYIDRIGKYLYPSATVQCAYAQEFNGHSKADMLIIDK